MLFRPAPRFDGLPAGAFEAFSIRDRDARRRAIVAGFHPALKLLGEDLLEILAPLTASPLYAHFPRLDWPAGYQPFCTWLAISHAAHGYQSAPQLNVGVHRDHLAVRLGWDTDASGFGRFEFLCWHGGVGAALADAAREHDLAFRVYAAAAWPEGSRRVFESASDWAGSFAEVRRRGVWWELGARYDLPQAEEKVGGSRLLDEAARVFGALLAHLDRIVGV
ncbi:MAG: DUF1054 family protein [Acidobacteriia bacterium]|nr:DUF1054 family protein [Terriglobia bacterium]